MPNKCARCGKIYDDNASELINGCECGARVFLYLKETSERTKEKAVEELKSKTIDRKDLDWFDSEFGSALKEKGKTIKFDIENLVRLGEGKFELDVSSLMGRDPLVIKAKNGVYYIDVPYAMEVLAKKKKG